MYVCMYVCMYVRMYVYVCVYIHMYLAPTFANQFSMYVCMYVCTYVCMYVYVCVYIRMYLAPTFASQFSMYVCMYVCMYTCVYIYVRIWHQFSQVSFRLLLLSTLEFSRETACSTDAVGYDKRRLLKPGTMHSARILQHYLGENPLGLFTPPSFHPSLTHDRAPILEQREHSL